MAAGRAGRCGCSDRRRLLLEELADPQRLVDAVIDRQRLHRYLLEHGGERRASSLGGDAGRILEVLLERCTDWIARLAPTSPAFLPAAATELLRSVARARPALEELLARPVSDDGVRAAEARFYYGEVRDTAPDELKGRRVELAQLADYARHGPRRWFGYQAPPQAGKTGLLATFALNPPAAVEVVPDQPRPGTRDLLFALGWRTGHDLLSRPSAHSPTLVVLQELAGAARIGWRVKGTDLAVAATERAVMRRN